MMLAIVYLRALVESPGRPAKFGPFKTLKALHLLANYEVSILIMNLLVHSKRMIGLVFPKSYFQS